LSQPLLSIIIPAHNEENRLPRSLEQVLGFLQQQSYEAEVLVVENGSTDRTLELAQGFAAQHTNLRVIHEPGRGKGLAVRRGMLEARGQYRFMCDADLSMPIEEVNKFLPENLPPYDVAVGSREVPGAVRYDEPAYRHVGGRLINLAIRMLILPRLQDTQCGFKCFRGEAATDLFGRQLMDGWSFDIEVLYLAEQAGYKMVEVPIHWYYRPESKVNAVQDAVRMIRDILTIRANMRRGLYDASRSRPAF
jgi:dolichyl-phosphate beta-glucosyltransferase